MAAVKTSVTPSSSGVTVTPADVKAFAGVTLYKVTVSEPVCAETNKFPALSDLATGNVALKAALTCPEIVRVKPTTPLLLQ